MPPAPRAPTKPKATLLPSKKARAARLKLKLLPKMKARRVRVSQLPEAMPRKRRVALPKRLPPKNPKVAAGAEEPAADGVRESAKPARQQPKEVAKEEEEPKEESEEEVPPPPVPPSDFGDFRRDRQEYGSELQGWCNTCWKWRSDCFKRYDWICRKCDNHNYARKSKCHCGAPRPFEQYLPDVIGNSFDLHRHCSSCQRPMYRCFRPRDWLCPVCGSHCYADVPDRSKTPEATVKTVVWEPGGLPQLVGG